MNFVNRHIATDAASEVAPSGFGPSLKAERKWPVHYDSIELLAVVADLATITLASVISGFFYPLHEMDTAGDIGKSVNSYFWPLPTARPWTRCNWPATARIWPGPAHQIATADIALTPMPIAKATV